MSAANPLHFIGGLFLEFAAAAAAIAVLWPTRHGDLPPEPQPIAWTSPYDVPVSPQPFVEHESRWEVPAYSPPPVRSFTRYADESREIRHYQPSVEPAPQVAFARPRVRSWGNEQSVAPPAYRTAERWDTDYRSRY